MQTEFWPHSVDLMALDSNVTLIPLRHFIKSDGVDMFAQNVSIELSLYVFPFLFNSTSFKIPQRAKTQLMYIGVPLPDTFTLLVANTSVSWC